MNKKQIKDKSSEKFQELSWLSRLFLNYPFAIVKGLQNTENWMKNQLIQEL